MSKKIEIVDYNSEFAPRNFTNSLRKTGFAVVKNHPIDIQLVNLVYKKWESFFKSDIKQQFIYDKNKQAQDGYFPFGTEHAKDYNYRDLKEFFNYYSVGQCPDSTSKQTKILYDDLCSLAENLLNWIELNTPDNIKSSFSMPLPKMVEKSKRNLFRIINYPPLRDSDDKNEVRAAAHEDINLITVLISATSSGLQALDNNNNWYEVPCDPGLIVVNIGDMLQMASNGYYPSTTHRVINPDNENKTIPRMSMPLFLHPLDNVKLSKDFTAGEYLDQRLKEIGLK